MKIKTKIIIAVGICICSLVGVMYVGNGGFDVYDAPTITVSDIAEHDADVQYIVEVKKLNSLKRTLVLYENESQTYLGLMGFSGKEYSFEDHMGDSYLKIHEEIIEDKKVMIVYGVNPNREVRYVSYTIDGKEEEINVGNDNYVFQTVIGESTQDILFSEAFSSNHTKLFRF